MFNELKKIINSSFSLKNSEILNTSTKKENSSNLTDLLNNELKKCIFCPKLSKMRESFDMINRALYHKYSSSQNYYYSKELKDFLGTSKKKAAINFKDLVIFEDEDEFLTECYLKKETNKKLKFLREYYKYHKDIPRFFMEKVSFLINKFYDKKRKCEYYKIKKLLLNDEEKNNDDNTSGNSSNINSIINDKNKLKNITKILHSSLQKTPKIEEKLSNFNINNYNNEKFITLANSNENRTLNELNYLLKDIIKKKSIKKENKINKPQQFQENNNKIKGNVQNSRKNSKVKIQSFDNFLQSIDKVKKILSAKNNTNKKLNSNNNNNNNNNSKKKINKINSKTLFERELITWVSARDKENIANILNQKKLISSPLFKNSEEKEKSKNNKGRKTKSHTNIREKYMQIMNTNYVKNNKSNKKIKSEIYSFSSNFNKKKKKKIQPFQKNNSLHKHAFSMEKKNFFHEGKKIKSSVKNSPVNDSKKINIDKKNQSINFFPIEEKFALQIKRKNSNSSSFLNRSFKKNDKKKFYLDKNLKNNSNLNEICRAFSVSKIKIGENSFNPTSPVIKIASSSKNNNNNVNCSMKKNINEKILEKRNSKEILQFKPKLDKRAAILKKLVNRYNKNY